MKIIYDNIIYSLQKCGGISVVWSNLISRIYQWGADTTFIEYEGAEANISRKEISLPATKICKRGVLTKVKRFMNPHINRSLNEKAQHEKFIFHSSYYRISAHPNAINVTTVHDFAYEYYVKNPIVRHIHSFQKFRAIRKSDHVVCISENTRRDLLKFLPNMDTQRISVIYNGVDGKFFREADAQTEDYVLYVGKRDRYKNFPALIQPLAQCHKRLKIVGYPLSQKEEEMMREAGLKYEYCGMVSDVELNHLYNNAFCLAYCSLYEGFGLPVIEAQQAGCPVIAINTSSIPEVIADKRLLMDEISTQTLTEKFELLSQPDTRADIVEACIKKAQQFSWDTMAHQYQKLYEQLLD